MVGVAGESFPSGLSRNGPGRHGSGWRRQFLSVADRDWFHPEGEKYFRFYTSPPLTIYIPAEAEDVEMTRKLFLRVRFLIGSGGYGTFDLG